MGKGYYNHKEVTFEQFDDLMNWFSENVYEIIESKKESQKTLDMKEDFLDNIWGYIKD